MKNIETDPFRRIFLVAHSQYRHLLIALARRLRDEEGGTLHLYASTDQEEDFYRKAVEPGLFASINRAVRLYDSTRTEGLDEAAVVAEAQRNEAWLGHTYNHLSVSDRHLGRGYALGGYYHPRSRYSEETGYLQMLHAYSRVIDYWREQFETKRPTLVIQGGKMLAVLARAMGVPFRQIAGSRYRNFHYWAWNEYFESGELEAAYASASNDLDIETALDAPYLSHRTMRDDFLRRNRSLSLSKRLILILARHLYWRLRGYEKARGYLLHERLAYEIRKQRDLARLIGPHMPRLASLEGRPFVFFPLHMEPEAALQTLSPEYFYQLSAIAAISRDLPAGLHLVVKDTPYALGRRPANFYDQIRDLKNVILLETLEPGLDIVRRASAVVTITGTAGFEAAILGKPVICFGRHNSYSILPHAATVTDESQLKYYLATALAPDFDAARARRDGTRFLQATIDMSFDLRDYDYIDLERFDSAAVTDALRTLRRSMETKILATPAAKTG